MKGIFQHKRIHGQAARLALCTTLAAGAGVSALGPPHKHLGRGRH